MENPDDPEEWKHEAAAVINDIKEHVLQVEVSSVLESSNSRIYFNLKTREGAEFCIELTANGFKVVGTANDRIDPLQSESQIFETPYSMLSTISSSFENSLATALAKKLAALDD